MPANINEVVFSIDELQEFQQLYTAHFESDLTSEEASIEALKLIELVSLIQPINNHMGVD